ncbi:MAG: hypothetical protein AB7D92_09750 [Sphaerochaeta sp.]
MKRLLSLQRRHMAMVWGRDRAKIPEDYSPMILNKGGVSLFPL